MVYKQLVACANGRQTKLPRITAAMFSELMKLAKQISLPRSAELYWETLKPAQRGQLGSSFDAAYLKWGTVGMEQEVGPDDCEDVCFLRVARAIGVLSESREKQIRPHLFARRQEYESSDDVWHKTLYDCGYGRKLTITKEVVIDYVAVGNQKEMTHYYVSNEVGVKPLECV